MSGSPQGPAQSAAAVSLHFSISILAWLATWPEVRGGGIEEIAENRLACRVRRWVAGVLVLTSHRRHTRLSRTRATASLGDRSRNSAGPAAPHPIAFTTSAPMQQCQRALRRSCCGVGRPRHCTLTRPRRSAIRVGAASTDKVHACTAGPCIPAGAAGGSGDGRLTITFLIPHMRQMRQAPNNKAPPSPPNMHRRRCWPPGSSPLTCGSVRRRGATRTRLAWWPSCRPGTWAARTSSWTPRSPPSSSSCPTWVRERPALLAAHSTHTSQHASVARPCPLWTPHAPRSASCMCAACMPPPEAHRPHALLTLLPPAPPRAAPAGVYRLSPKLLVALVEALPLLPARLINMRGMLPPGAPPRRAGRPPPPPAPLACAARRRAPPPRPSLSTCCLHRGGSWCAAGPAQPVPHTPHLPGGPGWVAGTDISRVVAGRPQILLQPLQQLQATVAHLNRLMGQEAVGR